MRAVVGVVGVGDWQCCVVVVVGVISGAVILCDVELHGYSL